MIPRDWFIDLGVPVFPIMPGTKKPDTHGVSWQNWRGRVPDVDRYGVPLGVPFVVADGDTSKATAWIRANLPETPFRVQTGPHHDANDPGRGVHFYYRAPIDVDTSLWPGHIHRDGLSIEIRRAGNYVLGPSSRHPSGATYRATDWSWSVEDLPFFPMDIVWNDGSTGISPRGEKYVMPEEVTHGDGRVPEMFRLLRSSQNADRSNKDMVRMIVWQFNLHRCVPPRFKPTADLLPTQEFDKWFNRSWQTVDTRAFTEARREQPVIEMELGL